MTNETESSLPSCLVQIGRAEEGKERARRAGLHSEEHLELTESRLRQETAVVSRDRSRSKRNERGRRAPTTEAFLLCFATSFSRCSLLRSVLRLCLRHRTPTLSLYSCPRDYPPQLRFSPITSD